MCNCPLPCVISGPGFGAGDASAEGARASWWAEEEALRAGWSSRGLGRGGGGWGQRTTTIHTLNTQKLWSTKTQICPSSSPPQAQVETSRPSSRPEDRLLSASFYLYTFQSLSPFFSSLFLFVCYLSQMKRCFFSKPASPPASGNFHKGSTKGSATGDVGGRNQWISGVRRENVPHCLSLSPRTVLGWNQSVLPIIYCLFFPGSYF